MLSLPFLLAAVLSPYGVLSEGLAIGAVGRGGRTPIQIDPLAHRLVLGDWSAPKAGDAVGNRQWASVTAGRDGWFQGQAFNSGYAWFKVTSPDRRIVMLQARGNATAWVNGVPRQGDPYSAGWSSVPVVLERGDNALLFSPRRGRFRAEIMPVKADAILQTADVTSADFVVGDRGAVWCAMVVANATEATSDNLLLRAKVDGAEATQTRVPSIVPLGLRKVGFLVRPPERLEGQSVRVEIELFRSIDRERALLDRASFDIRVRQPGQTVKRTFRSDVDGSVQYYAVVPPTRPHAQGLVLSLHGASVEATSQADAYSAKSWCSIVCPTNRRPFGFDWEEIGRLDALEVLADAKRTLRPSEDQVYLTGHSMGGHGAWQMSVNYPSLFAAVGPSAGWSSFFSYGGGVRYADPTPVEAILNRASNPSDTLGLLTNLGAMGVYILHGDADDNVPVSEARKFAQALGEFHQDWVLHEEKGAGHWWESSAEPGAECMDWPPMYDLFARRRIPGPDQRRRVDFATFNPGIGSTLGWVTISQQMKALERSRVTLDCEPHSRRFLGTTENVALLRLDLTASPTVPGETVEVVLDEQTLTGLRWPAEGVLWLRRVMGRWTPSVAPSLQLKTPGRNGTFKDVFRNRVVFVYGTAGTPEENAWALAKARLDSETFLVIGNGAPDVIPDTAFRSDAHQGRNVLLYGNADTNSAYAQLLPRSPVRVDRSGVTVGDRRFGGTDLAAFFIRPRVDSAASVAVLGGSGLVGMRLAERVPIFTSGVAIPDVLVLRPATLVEGTRGVVCAGFFGNDWHVTTGAFAW